MLCYYYLNPFKISINSDLVSAFLSFLVKLRMYIAFPFTGIPARYVSCVPVIPDAAVPLSESNVINLSLPSGTSMYSSLVIPL